MTKIYRHSALCLILTTIVCTLLISCGSEKPAQEGNGARVDYQLKWPVAKSVGSASNVPAGVDMIRMSLSGPGMLTKSFDFKVSEHPGGGTISNVPAGDNRTITFQGFSGPNIIYEKVSPPVTLVKGVPYSSNFEMAFTSNELSASPSGVSAEAVSSGQINLSWVDNSNNENSYIIERKSGAEANYTKIATVAANDTIYSDTQISSNTTYDYRVLAGNGTVSTTGASATTSGVIFASTYSLSGTVTSGGAALVGATVTRSGNGTTTTTVDSSGNYSFSGVQNGSYTLTPAMIGYNFYPPTLPINVNGANQTAMNFVATAVTVAPSPPAGLVATAPPLSNLINLAWTDTNNETGYTIKRTGPDGTYVEIPVAGNVTTYNDTAVSAGTTYIYQLRATNLNGDSGYSTVSSVTTPVKTYSISGTITGDGLVLVGVTVTLTGTGSTTTDSKGSYSFTGVRVGSYTLTSANAGYAFTPESRPITVIDADLSAINFVATPNSIPAIPTALIATPTSASRINLAWADNANNEARFEIERKTGADGAYVPIITVPANITTYNDLSVTGATTYYYKIRATNSVGPSAYTAEANATTIKVIAPMLVSVTGGTYNMGDTFGDGGQANELLVHPVTVRDFSIGKFEVTQGEWFAVMGGTDPKTPSFDWSDYPVVNVSWTAIQDFITTLNRDSGKSYRLPTEAEWEYAAAVRIDGVKEKYSGGSDTGAVSWYSVNSGNATHQVGTKQGNSRGIHDMTGNVFEWVSDRYGTYSSFSQTNPAGPVSGLERVTRGGGYQSPVVNVRTTFRASAVPNYIDPRIGFRLALSAP